MRTLLELQIILDQRQKRRLGLVLAGTLIAGFLEMAGIGAVPAFVGLLVEPGKLVGALPDGFFSNWIRQIDVTRLALYGAGLLAGLFLLKNLYLAMLLYSETLLTASVTASVAKRLFRAYLYSPYTFHLQRNPAKVVRNLTEEAVHCVDFIKGGMRLIREGLVLVVIFLLLLVVDPLVSFSVLSLFAFASGAFYMLIRHGLMTRGQLSQEHWARQVQIVNQALGVIKDAKLLGREPHLMNLFGHEVHWTQKHDAFYFFVSALPKLFFELLSVTGLLLVAVLFVLLGRPIQAMLPVLALFGVAVVRLVPAFTTINVSLAEIRYKRPALDLVSTELATLEESIENQHETTVSNGEPLKVRNKINLVDICYRYPGAPDEALQGVSAEINANEAIAFIGASGAGKSTLIDILLGLLKPTSGHVLVDGNNIHEDLPAWQKQIGYIAQDIYLVDDSIRRNIAFGVADEEIDEGMLARAVEVAQLGEFVRSLPEGLSTQVGNRGIRLSGGQRQRIGIARALYHDPSILIMDEATNALDNETEQEIIEAIGRLRVGRTIVMIAHRLSTVRGCDRLYVLEAGKIKDEGSIADLAKRHDNLKTLVTISPVHEIGIA
ncbi:MAG: hypothetical protein C5B60_07740 [Chloroflexi bacterium]|nr:MAG: hypothetical protein C5B60_07740 [Chloroflexota bacterium]